MELFTADLYRNFGIGFAAGALALAMTNGANLFSAVPQMIAAIF
ncbi:hypothetical protein [Qipengyuania marisflavi]|nr:hypothetical protein [Qipengyuania marisflavi]